jgi:transposase
MATVAAMRAQKKSSTPVSLTVRERWEWRDLLRRERDYASSMTEAEFALVRPFLMEGVRVTRPRTVDLRLVWNAIMYVLCCGVPWAELPKEFPPKSTVYGYFSRWRTIGSDGLCAFDKALAALRQRLRHRLGKPKTPFQLILDSQSVKTSAFAEDRGDDGAKKIGGIRRTILVDSLGLIWAAQVHRANRNERAAALDLMERTPPPATVRVVLADAGYQGPIVADGVAQRWPNVAVQIVKRSVLHQFVVLPKRWVVERTFAWLDQCRRLHKNVERRRTSSQAMLVLAALRHTILRLARLKKAGS